MCGISAIISYDTNLIVEKFLLDSLNIEFSVAVGWVTLLQTLLVTVYVAYFGSRGAEKFQTITKK